MLGELPGCHEVIVVDFVLFDPHRRTAFHAMSCHPAAAVECAVAVHYARPLLIVANVGIVRMVKLQSSKNQNLSVPQYGSSAQLPKPFEAE